MERTTGIVARAQLFCALILIGLSCGCNEADRYPTMKDARAFDCAAARRLTEAEDRICVKSAEVAEPTRKGVEQLVVTAGQSAAKIQEIGLLLEHALDESGCFTTGQFVNLFWERLDSLRRELVSQLKEMPSANGGLRDLADERIRKTAEGTEELIRLAESIANTQKKADKSLKDLKEQHDDFIGEFAGFREKLKSDNAGIEGMLTAAAKSLEDHDKQLKEIHTGVVNVDDTLAGLLQLGGNISAYGAFLLLLGNAIGRERAKKTVTWVVDRLTTQDGQEPSESVPATTPNP